MLAITYFILRCLSNPQYEVKYHYGDHPRYWAWRKWCYTILFGVEAAIMALIMLICGHYIEIIMVLICYGIICVLVKHERPKRCQQPKPLSVTGLKKAKNETQHT